MSEEKKIKLYKYKLIVEIDAFDLENAIDKFRNYDGYGGKVNIISINFKSEVDK